jgi:hypothetical protein
MLTGKWYKELTSTPFSKIKWLSPASAAAIPQFIPVGPPPMMMRSYVFCIFADFILQFKNKDKVIPVLLFA